VSRLRDLLATARVANLPSVVSNVMLGFALGAWHWGFGPASMHAGELLLLIGAGVCLYLAGTFGNDWIDRNWDRVHRPERALPAGRFPPSSYAAAAIAFALAGLILAALASPSALGTSSVLLLLVATYTWCHKRTVWSVLPMGLCRACLYFLGFLHMQSQSIEIQIGTLSDSLPSGPAGIDIMVYDRMHSLAFIATHGLGLFAWTVGISLNARSESIANPSPALRWLSGALLAVPLAAMSCWWVPWYPLAGALAIGPLAAWLALSLTAFRQPAKRRVSALLAGIPLVDLVTAIPLALSLVMPDKSIGSYPWLLAALATPVAAFPLGWLLQRVAPAT
jgi:4-hydroxybenzoate polyprenyltransferase